MVDEMYLEKTVQYHGCGYVGADDRETSIPYIVQAIPEVKFSGEWLADKILNCIDDLTSAKLFVQGIVTDNHSSCTCIFLTRWNVHFRFTLIHQAPKKL